MDRSFTQSPFSVKSGEFCGAYLINVVNHLESRNCQLMLWKPALSATRRKAALFSKMLSSMIESLEPGPNVSDYYYKTMVIRGRVEKVSGGWLAGKREWRFGPDAEKSARLGQGFGRRQPI
jgi:hypothetical protein